MGSCGSTSQVRKHGSMAHMTDEDLNEQETILVGLRNADLSEHFYQIWHGAACSKQTRSSVNDDFNHWRAILSSFGYDPRNFQTNEKYFLSFAPAAFLEVIEQ